MHRQWTVSSRLRGSCCWIVVVMGLALGGTMPDVGAKAADRARLEINHAAILTTPDREDEFPAIGRDADNRLWVAWVSYDGQRDEVLVSRLGANEKWSTPTRLSKNAQPTAERGRVGDPTYARDCWRPTLESDGAGQLWATWAQNEQGNWDIWASRRAAGQWSEPMRLTESPGNDFGQQLARDSAGRLWMTWQSVVEQNYEILAAHITEDGLIDVRNVSRHPASDWAPAIATDSRGKVYVGWDSYRHGSYDILISQLDFQTWTEPMPVAASPDYEAHASLAVDGQQRLWVAWDNGGPHWGQHGERQLRLHAQRSVHLVCLDGDQRLAPREPLAAVLTGELAKFCELPQLRVDHEGRLWMWLRHLRDVTPPGKQANGRPHQPRGIWNPVALCYANGAWSEPLTLPDSNGRNDMFVASCLDGTGNLWVAWAEDGRLASRAEEPINHNVHAAAVRAAGTGNVELPVVPAENLGNVTQVSAYPRPSSREITAGGVRYRLLYGDTHRHTDISRCGMNFDGSLIDTYRYAIDAAGLDFLAISDHDQDLLKHRYSRSQQGPLQGYAWWRSQKYCDLFYIANRFLPIYGYEHGGSYAARGGHKNVLYARRGMPCYEEDSPTELFNVLRDKEAVVIPHQLADGSSATDWSQWNEPFERVAEIFQTRGSYEYLGAPREANIQRRGHYLWDALASGVQIGVIASSDHGMVHNAYAGVYVREVTRSGVLEALRSRRTFGATEMISLDFRIGEQLLGERATIDASPTFQIRVEGVAPLEQVQVVRDGKFVFSTSPRQPTCQLVYTDTELAAGASASYYVRCQQADNQWAWSSAIWVQRKP